jgi:hypothetical protein
MNRFGSRQNHENRFYDGVPHQGLSKHGGQEVFLIFLVTDPPRGRPFRSGGIHHT